MKKDITNSEDVKKMVDTFYARVNKDELLSPIFNDFAGVDWDSHLPRMYSFWESVLFAKEGFKGRPFQKHIPLLISGQHFDRWLLLFTTNLNEHFEGPVTENAKLRANSIAGIFQNKLKVIHQFK